MPQPPPGSEPHDRRPIALFAAICVCVAAAVVAYVFYARARGGAEAPAPPPGRTAIADLREIRRGPHIFYRSTALGPANGRVLVSALSAPGVDPFVAGLSCERVYASPTAGLCLSAARGVFTSYKAVAFGASVEPLHEFHLEGTPSRTRVSASGRRGASTVFVSGDSYAGGGFSTRTTLFDLEAGLAIGDLEQFAVTKDGAPFKAADFNFWGVTFADDDRFYATLASGGRIHLVEGRISTRTIRTLREGVECPSLSPDGTRLVFKSRSLEGGRLTWRLHVLHLETGRETVVAESRTVDDQAAWLDDEHVLYALPHQQAGSGSSDIWVARADGTGAPQVLVRDATSPAVVRP